jgi:DNA mismatch repair protein MutS2
MRERDLERLEFFKVLDKIKEFVHSKATERFVDSIRPIKDSEHLKSEINITRDFMKIEENVPIYPFDDVEELIKRSSIKDAFLTVEEVLSLLKVIKLIKEVRKAVGSHANEYTNLQAITKNLYLFSTLETLIESSVDPRGFVKDSASEELSRIRQRIRSVEKEIMKRLESLLLRPDASSVFSDKFVAFKNNRYVLPVKTTEAKKIIGIVHGTSSSGFTTYIEPHNVVELNNQLVTLRGEEEDEIKRILRRITSYIGEYSSRLYDAFLTLLKVDFLKAVAKFAQASGGKLIQLGDSIELKSVKHPLLVFLKERVVSVDILLSERRGLLLTGPNTGGKTVALKTLGLCALMFQCALPVPAEESSKLPVFDSIFTDIGDEQNVEQNLSTFSAHISNIVDFLPTVDDKSLVLLDELGAGTDPLEGSALGIGLLEYLRKKGAYVFATTHHTPIKLYAINSDYYTPASVSFNKESLEPTYTIIYNTISESMALEIAKRYGIPDEILRIAQENLPEGSREYITAKENLENYIREYQEKLKELEQDRLELENLKKQQELLLYELERQKEHGWESVLKEAQEYLNQLMKEGEELLSSAKERQKLREFVKEKRKDIERRLKKEEIKVGDWVELMGSRGRVLEIKEGKAGVSFGGVKAWVSLKDLKKTEPPPKREEEGLAGFEIRKGLPSEISLIGMSVDEALRKLELFLEEAYRMGIKSVKVIHGHGVLKRTVEGYLSSSKLVIFHREGYPKEGGAGTSIVYLSRD